MELETKLTAYLSIPVQSRMVMIKDYSCCGRNRKVKFCPDCGKEIVVKESSVLERYNNGGGFWFDLCQKHKKENMEDVFFNIYNSKDLHFFIPNQDRGCMDVMSIILNEGFHQIPDERWIECAIAAFKSDCREELEVLSSEGITYNIGCGIFSVYY